jgi:two-component system OmpR family sensor kinase
MMKFHAGQLAHPGARPGRRAPWHLHVFPMGRMCSLRRALLLWLVPLFLLVGVSSAAFSYWSHGRMVHEFMDDQMQQLGDSIASSGNPVVPPSTTTERAHKWGTYIVQVYAKDGALQLSSCAQMPTASQQDAGFRDLTLRGTDWRVYTAMTSDQGQRVQVFQSGEFRRHVAAEQAIASAVPVLILLPLAILVLWSVARAVSVAVQDIGKQAASQDINTIAELPLQRVPQEIQPLVTSFNTLLTRLRDSFESKRRFVQDAAHELRTPLTALSLQLENLRRDLPDGACSQSFAQLETGVSRASRVVDQLMKLTRQEAAPREEATAVDLHAQVHESINALIALADQRNIDLGVTGETQGGVASLRCAPSDLRSVLDNLIENALRYTPEGGVVDVRVVTERGKHAIEVVDTGPGIPPELMERVFDRFFRVPGSPARGSGLGLSIAQSAAQRCGMHLSLRNRVDRSGLIARIEVV